MKKSQKFVALFAALGLGACVASQASAAVIAGWSFENYPTNAATLTNNPLPSTGAGTAGSIGMTNSYNSTTSVTTDDVLQGVAADTGTNGTADLTNIFRVRGTNPGNGWSSQAPIGTQGAQFSASTVGYTGPVTVSFDWYTTNQGEAKLQLEYTTDGINYSNIAITPAGSDAGLSILTNSTSPNTVMGSYASGGSSKQNWFTGLTATINDPAAVNDPNFGIEMVNAATGADDTSISGTPLNNTSGNWRFDNVSISVPEPTSMGILAIAAAALLNRRRRA